MEKSNIFKMIYFVFVLVQLDGTSGNQHLLKEAKKQKLLQLIGNSVSMNLSSEVKTNGIENSIVLKPWRTAEVFFEINENGSSLAIFIDLMCYATLQWSVNLLDYSSIRSTWKKIKIDFQKGETGPRTFLHMRNSDTSSMDVALASYVTEDSELFKMHYAPKGFYKIEMRSTVDFMQVVKVSVLAGGNMKLKVPTLPPDDRVSVAHLAENNMHFLWEPAKISDGTEGGQVKYCISVNVKRKLKYLCEVYDLLSKRPKDVIMFQCLYGENRFNLHERLSSDMNHHLNVFAVNPHSNRSRAYVGLTLPKQRSSLINHLRQNSTINLKMDTKENYRVIKFNVKIQKTLRISYVACEGPVTIYLARGNRVLKKFNVNGIKTQTLKAAKVGAYVITLTKKFHGALSVRIHLSSNKRWGPFPRLPKGVGVKDWPMLRTCNSVTLAWIASHGKQQFCLFVGRETKKLYKQIRNVCFKPTKDTRIHKITCIYKRIRKDHKAVFTRTIKGLQPCSTYLFYIQVKRRRSTETLVYKPLRVKTRCKRCN